MTVKELNQIVNENEVVLVDFYAQWCGPCRMLLPLVEQVMEEEKSWLKVVKINVDENPELANEFKVRSIPTLVLFKGGEVSKINTGFLPKDELLKFCGK